MKIVILAISVIRNLHITLVEAVMWKRTVVELKNNLFIVANKKTTDAITRLI